MLHIKLKGIKNAATLMQIFYLQTSHPSDPGSPWGWSQKVKTRLFSEHGHVANQIKGNH